MIAVFREEDQVHGKPSLPEESLASASSPFSSSRVACSPLHYPEPSEVTRSTSGVKLGELRSPRATW
jgi:hypothetical protein